MEVRYKKKVNKRDIIDILFKAYAKMTEQGNSTKKLYLSPDLFDYMLKLKEEKKGKLWGAKIIKNKKLEIGTFICVGNYNG